MDNDLYFPVPEIKIGHDPGCYFWIMPVKCHNKNQIIWNSVEENRAYELSIEENDIEQLLYHFLKKYFDSSLIYNQRRCDVDFGGFLKPEFEWYMEYNFYTRATIQTMLSEISAVADALEVFDTERIPGQLLNSDACYFNDREMARPAVLFYRRFVQLMTKMVHENPDWPLISFMGP